MIRRMAWVSMVLGLPAYCIVINCSLANFNLETIDKWSDDCRCYLMQYLKKDCKYCHPSFQVWQKFPDFTINDASGITLPQMQSVLLKSLIRVYVIDVSSFREKMVTNITPPRCFLIYIYIYIYILPYPCRVEFSGEWSNRVAISVYCKPLHIWIEVSVAVKRMYVNNSNCDSWPFIIYFNATSSLWLKG